MAVIFQPPPTVRAPLRWSRIRTLGSSRIVRFSFVWLAVVPVAAKVVYSLKQSVRQPPWAMDLVQSLHLPFSWQVLFWSALSMTLGTLQFDAFCPKIVRRHAHFGSFVASGEHISHLLEYAEQVTTPRSRAGNKFTVYDMTTVHGAGGTKFHHGVGLDEGPELTHADVFWRLLTVAETHGPWKLRCTAALYGVGLGLFGVVVMQNLWWVLRALVTP